MRVQGIVKHLMGTAMSQKKKKKKKKKELSAKKKRFRHFRDGKEERMKNLSRVQFPDDIDYNVHLENQEKIDDYFMKGKRR